MNRRYSGFTLTEVLVSVFVLTVGVIGVTRMELNALSITQQSVFQTAAVQLATDIAEKIRTDAASATGDADLFLDVDYSTNADIPDVQETTCFNADRCDARQLAEFDIHEWERQLRTSLPSGRARICRDDAPWEEGKRSYRWECSDAGPMVVKIGWRARTPNGAAVQSGGAFPPAVVMSVGVYPA